MRTVFALAAAALLLAAGAHPGNSLDLASGTPREQVIARAGPPVRVDLDAAGRVVRRAHPAMEFINAPADRQ